MHFGHTLIPAMLHLKVKCGWHNQLPMIVQADHLTDCSILFFREITLLKWEVVHLCLLFSHTQYVCKLVLYCAVDVYKLLSSIYD